MNLAKPLSEPRVANPHSKGAYGFAGYSRPEAFSTGIFVAFVSPTPYPKRASLRPSDKESPYPASPIPYACARTPLDL